MQSSVAATLSKVEIVQSDSVASAMGTSTTVPPMGSTASSVSGLFVYATSGTVRSGFVQTDLKFTQASNYTGSGDQAYSLSLGGSQILAGDCFLSGHTSSCQLTRGSGLIPFQLGVPFTVAFNASLTASSGGYGNSTRSLDNMASTFSFQLFEANGTTSVPLDDPATAPEPGTYLLVCVGIAIVWLSRRRLSGFGKRQ